MPSDRRVSPACTKKLSICKPARCTEEHACPVTECHIHVPRKGVILALELLDDGTVAVLERVHHLLQEEQERSEIVFREDFAGDMQRVFALAAELLQIAVRVTDSRANHLVWLIRSKMQRQWRAAMSILARVPITLESQFVAEERRIRDRLEEAVIVTHVGQDEQVARLVVVLPSRVVAHVKVAA